MSMALNIDSKRKVPVTLTVLIAAITLQSLHFYFYYEQGAANSAIWSLVDWSAWFLVIALVHYGFSRLPAATRGKYYWPAFAAVVLLAGPLQILLSSLVYGLISEPSRPFLEDIMRLYDKRWLQNLIYAGLLWQLFNNLWPLKPKPANGAGGSIKVSDGKSVHLLKPGDIRYVESERNYLFIHLDGRKIMVRDALKDFMARVPSDVFIRVSRSHLVNISAISRIEPYSKHSKQVVLKDGTSLQIGRTYLAEVNKALAK